MRRMSVVLRNDQYAWLKAESKSTGRSMSAIIRDAIDAYFGLPPWEDSVRTRGARSRSVESSEVAR